MNSRMLRNTTVALSVVGAAVAAWLLVAGTGMTRHTNTAVGTPATSTSLPRPLGRGDQELSAGPHVLDLVALDTAGTGPAQLPKIALTLPSGWRSYEGYAVLKSHMGLSFWDVDHVYATPCRWQSKGMVDPGTTVGGLASALARQPLRSATTPTNVVLAGVRGKYLRLAVPKDIDFARCDKGSFESWTGLGWSSDRWEQGPGQVDRIWILNIHGWRLVVDANYLPSATTNDRAELNRVVHSIRLLPTAASHTGVGNGALVAYATAPAGEQSRLSPSYRAGSDVFIIRAGGQPKLVAGRGSGTGTTWNLCPAFSPNGKMLAYGRKAPGGQAIIVVGVKPDGTLGPPSVTLNVPGRRARCPKWSSDSSRLAYVDRSGKIVVRALDGSTRHRTAGDPTLPDFDRHRRKLLSPAGDLVARESWRSGLVVVSQPDGSDRRVINAHSHEYPYAIAGWSPDGRKVLLMTDVGDGFMMRAVSVEAPFTSRRIVNFGPVNGDRSWPRYGDVSWQPIPRR
jgi:hypothetical protein